MATRFGISIDTEEGWDWEAGWPVRSHSLENVRVAPRFEQLCAKHGARTTWFTNWSVLNDGPSRDLMLGVASRPGVELGMHVHPWLTPPREPKWEAEAKASFLHNQPAELVHAKLTSVYELFEKAGVRPTSFRGGRYSSGGAIHDFLLSKGFVADSSVVPFTAWQDEGAPDFRGRDMTPQRIPHPANGPALWEVPLTLGFTRTNFRRWGAWFNAIDGSFLRRLRIIGILSKLGIARRVWLNFEAAPFRDMMAFLRVLRPLSVPFVLFTVHSSSLVVGGNPYSASEERVRDIWETVELMLKTLETWNDFQPATVSEIAHSLEARHQSQRIEASQPYAGPHVLPTRATQAPGSELAGPLGSSTPR
jgi:hypothetical protein